ncbi:hypothetical protein P9112_006753 [Eukaryota sp. TZLM1-RC]
MRAVVKSTDIVPLLSNQSLLSIRDHFSSELDYLLVVYKPSTDFWNVRDLLPHLGLTAYQAPLSELPYPMERVIDCMDVILSQFVEIVSQFVELSVRLETLINNIYTYTGNWPSSGAVNIVIFSLFLISQSPDRDIHDILETVNTIVQRRGVFSTGLTSIKQFKISRVVKAMQERCERTPALFKVDD